MTADQLKRRIRLTTVIVAVTFLTLVLPAGTRVTATPCPRIQAPLPMNHPTQLPTTQSPVNQSSSSRATNFVATDPVRVGSTAGVVRASLGMSSARVILSAVHVGRGPVSEGRFASAPVLAAGGASVARVGVEAGGGPMVGVARLAGGRGFGVQVLPPPAGKGAAGGCARVGVGPGRFVWPLDPAPVVGRPFDPPPGPYAAGHRGVDLVSEVGATVLAAADGEVVFAGRVVDRGVVAVRHGGGVRTSYEPVEASVAVGARVRAGDAIGVLVGGHRGCPVAACLHWGLRREGVYLDPLLALTPLRVRLLPH